VWMCGCVDVWMCGCVGVWMCGCVDVWMCGCVEYGGVAEDRNFENIRRTINEVKTAGLTE